MTSQTHSAESAQTSKEKIEVFRTSQCVVDQVLNDDLHPVDGIALRIMIERGMVEIVDNASFDPWAGTNWNRT
ncbi:hypothetical protein AZH53_06150 [Methanomicrobiaceae archaeon CYW5]|nr:hypothetical protein [Methanovulcanius yangii]